MSQEWPAARRQGFSVSDPSGARYAPGLPGSAKSAATKAKNARSDQAGYRPRERRSTMAIARQRTRRGANNRLGLKVYPAASMLKAVTTRTISQRRVEGRSQPACAIWQPCGQQISCLAQEKEQCFHVLVAARPRAGGSLMTNQREPQQRGQQKYCPPQPSQGHEHQRQTRLRKPARCNGSAPPAREDPCHHQPPGAGRPGKAEAAASR